MAKKYDAILGMLYSEFGDDLLELGKSIVSEKIESTINSNKGEAKKSKEHAKPKVGTEPASSDETSSVNASDENEAFDYYDAEIFEHQVLGKMSSDARAVLDSKDVAAALENLICMAGEVRKFEEAQITVRTDIAAKRDIALANIEMQKTALLTYLDKSFDERKENFQALFNVVDDALEKDNMQQLALSLQSIVQLAEVSPFKDLASVQTTAAALTDPDHEWDF